MPDIIKPWRMMVSRRVSSVQKEIATKQDLLFIIDLLDSLNMKYWIDGGWGIDILVGKQQREHRDIDVDFDESFQGALLEKLSEAGYSITTDWRPSRIELYSPQRSYIDIHPLKIRKDGSAKQADPSGGWYHFEAEYFGSSKFEGKVIPCISAKAQKLFHTGYELRDKDIIDMKNLDTVLSEE